MKAQRILTIKDGVVSGFAGELDFDGLAVVQYDKRRVSRIVPASPVKRLFFNVLRLLVSDCSAIAEWTRSWDCPWRVVIDRAAYGPFANRAAAITFEKQTIYAQGKLTPPSC